MANDRYTLEDLVYAANPVLIAASILGVMAYYTSHPALFYICSSLALVLSIATLLIMRLQYDKQPESTLVVPSILLLLAGIWIDGHFLPGILLGGMFAAITLMYPFAERRIQEKIAAVSARRAEKKLKKVRQTLHEQVIDVEDKKDQRLAFKHGCYQRVTEGVKSLDSALDDFEVLDIDINELALYFNTGQWGRDQKAFENGELNRDTPKALMMPHVLYDTFDSINDLRNRLLHIADAIEIYSDADE